jgi:hypothetical protein
MKTYVNFLSHLAQFLLERGMVQTKVVERIKTHFMFSNLFSPENRAFYEMMWKYIVEPGRPDMTL